jgi:hypothetical protein
VFGVAVPHAHVFWVVLVVTVIRAVVAHIVLKVLALVLLVGGTGLKLGGKAGVQVDHVVTVSVGASSRRGGARVRMAHTEALGNVVVSLELERVTRDASGLVVASFFEVTGLV